MHCLSKPVKVKTITTGETFGADVALMTQVKWKVKLEGTNQDGQCTIVFCPITSRVGSDVEAAMERVPWGKRIILVLMHHTRDVDYSTAGMVLSEKYPNINLEVHVLFHESVQGLLTCSKNTDAVYQMQKYLELHGETTWLSRWWPIVLIGLIVLFLVLLWHMLE
ncbi:hypothetical protein AMECASPLE_037987 [Ameca splendens]|uniref:Uncharacterized protein n=1 Tax=Ameca splendens TaxID=208324 RepID=A0ABV0XL66_9TELE